MQVAATVWWRQQVTLFLVLILLSTSILGRTQSTDEKQLPRIVAMGDLHGDLANTLAIMKHAGIVDDEGRWAGGNAIFVQTGDVVDRGVDTIKLYQLLQRLEEEALAQGGQVVRVLGNHEIMNMIGDWRYVHPDDIRSFGGQEARMHAFSEDGWIGKVLLELNLTAQVGNSVFCHGGIHPIFALNGGIERINRDTRNTLKEYVRSRGSHQKDPHGLYGGHGPTWYRGYALDKESEVCPLLDQALQLMGVDRMVMGHTVQRNGRITTRCDGKAVFIDIGISHVYGGHFGALEIVDDELFAIYKHRRESLVPRKPNPFFVHEEL